MMPVLIFLIINIYCNICSKSLKGSFRELTLLTFEYFKNTNARQDRTHTHKKREGIKGKKQEKYITRSPQGLYNWAACDVTSPNLSPFLSLTFQVISGTPQIFRLLNPRDKKRYYATIF